jgi:hypothetical protein
VSTGAHVAAVFFFIASGCSAYLWSRLLTFPLDRSIRLLSGIVLWEIIQLVPVHLLAGLQIAGLIARLTIPSLAAFQGAILAGSLVYMVWRRPRPSPERPAGSAPKLPLFLVVSIAILTCSYLVFALDLFTSFPNGSDEIAYHLPLAVHWLQTGSLAIPPTRTWRFSLPGNSEIEAMMLLATGKESAVALFNWPALAALVTATYLLAKRLTRGNRVAATAVVLVLLSIPIVEFQALSAYVDLFGTAFLLVGFVLLIRKENTGGTRSPETDGSRPVFASSGLFLSAAACGISLGTKPIFWVYGAGYSVLAVFSLWKSLGKRSGAAFARGIVLIAIGLLLPSAFWFGRAVQATRNPVFPMQIAVAGHVVFPGYPSTGWFEQKFEMNFVRSRSEWFIYPWTEWKRDPGYLLIPYGEGSGVGAAFAALVPIGVLFLIYRSLILRLQNRTEVILLLVLALSLVVWWFLLYRIPRYGLPILVFTCLLTAPLVAFLHTYRRRGFEMLFLILMSVTFAISTFMPVHELLGRIRGRNWTRHEFYGYPPFLDHLSPGSCVLNATGLEEKNYPLTGMSLGNCVVPAFEISGPLTANFLAENGVDYIAEIIPEQRETRIANIPSVTLVKSELVKNGETKVRWRVWKVAKP